ncbi:hypothetical protein NEILACOT_04570 [Neisseria lactamica ATCC 23970]|uniref:Uncharacterized protein n=1 Tax=Neisseria lactamica ATCC 23970 TaxID=546265 RepID=D0WAJ9_NEILA|nr:hypothetical protein NEILACOT_04570 [Neisseria lactamica ATCC 23970]
MSDRNKPLCHYFLTVKPPPFKAAGRPCFKMAQALSGSCNAQD